MGSRVPAWRQEARRRVVAAYFPPEEQVALTPTAHDLFDAGLWTIDDNLRIQVAHSDISESILPGGSHFKLADLHSRPLSFAPQATLRPIPTHLAGHRLEVFSK